MERGGTTPSSGSGSRTPSSPARAAACRPRLTVLALAAALAWSAAGAQTPSSLADGGDYVAAWEKASQTQTAAMQTTAARAATDRVVYGLALEGAALADQLVWLNRAVTAAQTAVGLDPTSAAALIQLARAKGEIARRSGILQNLGVAPELKELFDRALALEPANADALVGLAMWHLELVENGVGWLYGGRKDAVEPLLARGVAAAPEQVNLRVEYARALIALGKPADARAQLELAASLPSRRVSDDIEKAAAAKLLAGLGQN